MRAVLSCMTLAIVLLSVAPAHADTIPPDVEMCSGKAEGDACELLGSGKGICVKDSCTRWSYDPETGNRTASERECIRCKPGSPAAQPAQTTGTTQASVPTTDAVPKQRGGCATPGGEGAPMGVAMFCAALGLLAVCRRRGEGA